MFRSKIQYWNKEWKKSTSALENCSFCLKPHNIKNSKAITLLYAKSNKFQYYVLVTHENSIAVDISITTCCIPATESFNIFQVHEAFVDFSSKTNNFRFLFFNYFLKAMSYAQEDSIRIQIKLFGVDTYKLYRCFFY